MAAVKETVLYYTPEKTDKVRILKSVLVRLGIRIKNIGPEQVQEQVGYLAGLPGFAERAAGQTESAVAGSAVAGGTADTAGRYTEADRLADDGTEEAADDLLDRILGGVQTAVIPEEMLVLHNFSGRRLDQLLAELRRAKASVALKAVLTETNCEWTFYELYQEIKKEHEMMHGNRS